MSKNIIYKKKTKEEISIDMARAASVLKLACGVVNNATWLVMMDGHDAIKKHPNYRHQAKKAFKDSIQEFRNNERKLLYARNNRMFHIDDMYEETRKKFGDITDAQYFEYWQGLGAKAYTDGHKWVSNLANKYRISLIGHQIHYADELSKVMVAQACLELCCSEYQTAIKTCASDYCLPVDVLENVFVNFNLRRVADLWRKGMSLIEPKTNGYELDDIEDKNITQGIVQLHDEWSNPRMLYGSVIDATEDFEDIFRTKGEKKKTLGELSDVLAEADEIMKSNAN